LYLAPTASWSALIGGGPEDATMNGTMRGEPRNERKKAIRVDRIGMRIKKSAPKKAEVQKSPKSWMTFMTLGT